MPRTFSDQIDEEVGFAVNSMRRLEKSRRDWGLGVIVSGHLSELEWIENDFTSECPEGAGTIRSTDGETRIPGRDEL